MLVRNQGAVIIDRAVTIAPAGGEVETGASSVSALWQNSLGNNAGWWLMQTTVVEDAEANRAQKAVAAMLAHGYILTSGAMEKAKELDAKAGMSAKASAIAKSVSSGVQSVDDKLKISENAKAAASKTAAAFKGFDEKYKVGVEPIEISLS